MPFSCSYEDLTSKSLPMITRYLNIIEQNLICSMYQVKDFLSFHDENRAQDWSMQRQNRLQQQWCMQRLFM